MNIQEALTITQERFPFKGYMPVGKGVGGAYTNIAATVSRHLRPGGKILDVGCGPCDKTALLQLLGFQCSGFDDLKDDWHSKGSNREKILAFARSSGIDLRLPVEQGFPFEKETFDMLMLHDILEHLHDSPRDMLNDLLELVKPGGFLYITVPNAVNIRKRVNVLFGRTNHPEFATYYWYPGPWRGHIREYVRSDLEKLSTFLNLERIELRGCDHMLEKLPPVVQPVYRAVTALLDGWKDSWQLVARKPADWVPRKGLSQSELVKILGMEVHYEQATGA